MEFLFSKVAGSELIRTLIVYGAVLLMFLRKYVLFRESVKWFTVPSYRNQLISGQHFRPEFCLIVKVNAWCPRKGHICLNKPAATSYQRVYY